MDEQQLRPALARSLRATRHTVSYGLSWAAPLVAPDKRFVLAGTGRVGSQLLVTLLNSHPDIVCEGEIITADDLLFPRRFVEWRAMHAGIRGARAYGFKVLTIQVREHPHLPRSARFFADLHGRGHVIVLVKRRNLLNVAVSFLQAHSVGWHHTRSGPEPATGARRITLDPSRVVAALSHLSESSQWNDAVLTDVPHLTVTYEDDLEVAGRHQATVDMITDALGLPAQPVTSNLVRVVPPRLRDRLANYDDVAALVRQTRFANFLDDESGVLA